MPLHHVSKTDSSDPQLFAWMCEIRQFLHQNPEFSFSAFETAKYIQEKLNELGIPSRGGLGGTGILAEIGPANALLTVGLRADMDALPITEDTDLPFASTKPGCMHACGNDRWGYCGKSLRQNPALPSNSPGTFRIFSLFSGTGYRPYVR